jgi:hypothetical protein
MVYRRDKEFLDLFYKASKLVAALEKKIKRNKYFEKLI